MLLREFLNRTGEGKAAVVGWGRGMGHKGHMYLASSVITQAGEEGADPYFVVSRTVGKDDPITPEEKMQIYKKVFPKHGHIFHSATDEMPDLTRVLTKLDKHGYTDVTVVVGADQVKALSYVKQYNGVPNKAGETMYSFNSLNVISRQETNDPSREEEGPRATPMRAVLTDPDATEEQKFQTWRDAMSPEISDAEVHELMNKAHERMQSFSKPKAKAKKVKDQDVAEGLENIDKMTSLVDLPVFGSTGTSKVAITGDGRITAVVNVRGVHVPFYISTGEGGKLSVPTGMWYPFFGSGPSGYLNKGTEDSINKFYGSKVFERYASLLNRELGNLMTVQEQVPMMKKSGRDIINQDMAPMDHAEIEANPEEFKKRVNAFLAKIGDKPFYTAKKEKVADEGIMSLLGKTAPAVKKPASSLSSMRAATAADNVADALPPPHIRMYLQRIKDAKSKGIQPQFSASEYATLQQWIKNQQVYGKTLETKTVKQVNKILREMRAHQFIKEGSSSGVVGKGGTKPIDKEMEAAMRNATTIPGLNMSTGSQYMNYRMGIALAGAPDYPTKMAADNWIGGDPLISSYTQEEYDMVKAAALQVGAGTIENWTGKRSEEMADVNKTSAVAKVKRNKYGI